MQKAAQQNIFNKHKYMEILYKIITIILYSQDKWLTCCISNEMNVKLLFK